MVAGYYDESGTILKVQDLGKNYGDFALDGISFELGRGYVMGLIGPNGSGKTTTIKLILNLLRKDSGEIEIFGLNHERHEREIKNRIGFVFDENHYYGVLTIEEMKRLIAPLYRDWDEKIYQKYLREFNLNPKQKIDKLSKGMKMKFSLVMALSHQAELILMDEPTSGLDPVFRSELLDILYYLISDGDKSILFSTHITSDLEKIADYITFINQGKLVFSCEKDQALEEYLLVKGPSGALTPSLEKEFIGLRKTAVGFEGLFPTSKHLPLFREHVITEQPSLDDIMVYVAKSMRGGY